VTTTELRRPATLETRPRDGAATAVLAAITAIPFVVATVRALSRGWMAVGDNGNFLIRSRDVLTSHHPLLGTWSSASIAIGENVNHPGPLLFDVLAIPAKLGGAGGLAVGVLLLHLACIALLAVFARRAGGIRLAATALVATAGLAWSMGSELLYDPWNPHVLLFPFLLLLVLVVAMSRGDRIALPIAVGVGSLIVETHLSYALLVPPLVLWGLAWLARRHGVRTIVRPVVAALVVGVVCWAQPVADQLVGEGNLGALARSVGTKQDAVGAGVGARIVADVVATPPWWGRDGFGHDLRVPAGQSPLLGPRPNIAGLPGASGAVIGLAIVGVVLALALLRARRQRDDAALAAVAAATFGLAVAIVVTIRLPIGGVGVPPHQVRYLWPLAAFATAAAVLALAPRRWGASILALAVVVLTVLDVPFHAVVAGPQADADAIPIARQLCSQLGTLRDDGTLVYDTSRLRFAEPWTSAILACLQERHVDFTLDDPVWVRQLGSARADDGAADARIFVREGDAAVAMPPDGIRRVAVVEGLDDDERRELGTLERSLVDVPVVLNRAGRAALAHGSLQQFAGPVPPTAEQLLSYGGLAALLHDGLLVVPHDRARALARYADLRFRWDRHTVALFLDPKPYRA